jgi:hypothetical protein
MLYAWVRVKVKFTVEQSTTVQTGSSGIELLSLTSALDGVGGQHYAPTISPPRKTRFLLCRRLVGPKAVLDVSDKQCCSLCTKP